ncbi:MAG: helix-turn-helix transcriptional regulator [Clostridia bacterium]|nr:helix-turn-helix transcriptional regulator [Clostridia bacterium]
MFKDILLNLLKENNLNQRQLSKLTNIPTTTISGWINANRLPDYNALIKLRLFFNVSADYLLGLEKDN